MLAAALLLRRHGHGVEVLGSGVTSVAAAHAGLRVRRYARAHDPDTKTAFERQAAAMMAAAAGPAIAFDVRDAIREYRPDLVVADCMLPAALAAGAATPIRTVSLVHFCYGLARRQMLRAGGTWTTDLPTLNATRRELGLPELADGLAAWESAELVLVTAPRWFDVDLDYPHHVVHAGPLGGAALPPRVGRSRILLSFSTTVMDDQDSLIERTVAATSDLDAALTTGGADHDALLPECAAVVTHGGLGTTLRALAHGVPLLMLPLGRDQPANARRVAELGAGIALDAGATAEQIRTAVSRLVTEPGFSAAAAELAERIAAAEPDERALAALVSAASS